MTKQQPSRFSLVLFFFDCLLQLIPFLYVFACWIQLALCGNPAPWNLLGRFLLAIF